MKFAVIGTGIVGQTIAAKLSSLGHSVVVGTRNPETTLARTEPDAMGNAPYKDWAKGHSAIGLANYAEAAAGADMFVNATSGTGSLEAFGVIDPENLNGKILIDISNPLDHSRGFPPSLTVCNTNSLCEQIQRTFPLLRVVKTLNIVSAPVMVNPGIVPGGQPTMFLSGNDIEAKSQVRSLLENGFGWNEVVDLGDISTARGMEMILPLWVRIFGVLQTPLFGMKLVH